MANENLNNLDTNTPTKLRRKTGKYYTNVDIGKYVADFLWTKIRPNVILEPYVGGGSLIIPFFDKEVTCVVNDINKKSIDLLREKFPNTNCLYKNTDFLSVSIDEIFDEWLVSIGQGKKLLLYSNPPFGTISTNKLVTKKGEIEDSKSRKIHISYEGLDNLYGKGDLLLPAIGKMIEIIRNYQNGYLAFFSPLGVFCGRERYNKLLNRILKDFVFIYGEIFPGNLFHGVNKNKPIAFTVWEYSENVLTKHEDLTFNWERKKIGFKRTLLLKDCWKYDTRRVIKEEIAVQGNDRFNVPVPKIFHVDVKKGGSELVPNNVKHKLNIDNIPEELIYGLWSVTVGNRAIIKHPIYVDNAYTHLPDFKNKKTFEILTYSLLFSIIVELINSYTKGGIGFFGEEKNFRFGSDRLTKGAIYLIKTYGYCPVGQSNILDTFNYLKSLVDVNNLNKDLRKLIRQEIAERLKEIQYWSFIPLPQKKINY